MFERASLVAQLVKNLPAMWETWVRKIPCWREWLPIPVFWRGEFHGLYNPWGHTELDTTEWLSLFTHESSSSSDLEECDGYLAGWVAVCSLFINLDVNDDKAKDSHNFFKELGSREMHRTIKLTFKIFGESPSWLETWTSKCQPHYELCHSGQWVCWLSTCTDVAWSRHSEQIQTERMSHSLLRPEFSSPRLEAISISWLTSHQSRWQLMPTSFSGGGLFFGIYGMVVIETKTMKLQRIMLLVVCFFGHLFFAIGRITSSFSSFTMIWHPTPVWFHFLSLPLTLQAYGLLADSQTHPEWLNLKAFSHVSC